jgi:hypothetical protein
MGIFVGAKRNPNSHTIAIILQLRKIPGISLEPSDPGTPLPSAVPPPPPPVPTSPPPGSRRPRQ